MLWPRTGIDINASVQRYVVLKVLVSGGTAIGATIIMASFGLDFWFLMGVAVFVLNFIPYIGSIVATILPLLLGLLQFDSAWTALWMALPLAAIQLTMGNLVEPALQGRSLNLSPLLILVALALWGWLWGLVGMVLAVPICVTLRIALEHFPRTRPISILMSNVSRKDVRERQHLRKLAKKDAGEDDAGDQR